MNTTQETRDQIAHIEATLKLGDLTVGERSTLEEALADLTGTERPKAQLREPATYQRVEATVQVPLTQAELALLQEWAVAHILELENRQTKLENQADTLELAGADQSQIDRLLDKHQRITNLLDIDGRLDYKLYQASTYFETL